MDFSLFKKEKKILEQARELVVGQNNSPEELKKCMSVLVNAFYQSCREQKRLIRISDRQQEQLRVIKEELLAKTDQLERQTANLKVLNENLASEIAVRKEVENRLRYMANTDVLTGVNSRRRFLELLDKEIKRTNRTDQPFCLMIMDIDFFKTVNDRFGHAVGDQVLSHFADLLLSNIREIDEAGRLGGEEFGVILPGTSINSAFNIAQRLCSTVENQEIFTSAKKINITVSIGVSELKIGETGDQLIIRADTAMYAAKQNGRNRVETA